MRESRSCVSRAGDGWESPLSLSARGSKVGRGLGGGRESRVEVESREVLALGLEVWGMGKPRQVKEKWASSGVGLGVHLTSLTGGS